MNRQNKGLIALILSLGFSSVVRAVAPNPQAPIGGILYINQEKGEPPTIHPITSQEISSQELRNNYIGDFLAVHDLETYEWKPRLAESWEISKDNKTFTFHLRKGALFHDGTEITADDVKFSFDAIFEPKYEAAMLVPYFDGISKVEVVDKYTIKATAKDTYFKNFDVIANLEIIPKHVYQDVEKSKKMNHEYVGSGPYKLVKFDRGQSITLERFDQWYGFKTPEWKGYYNVAKIILRFYKDETVLLEHFKKGDLDFVDLRAESFIKRTDGEPWGKTIFKRKIQNLQPKYYSFIAWNLRQPMFQDKNVRLALSHLLNRADIIKKFTYDLNEATRGPLYNSSEYASPNVKAIEYDPKKALALLAKAGWRDSDKKGILQKVINGKKVDFRFALSYAVKENEKYWTIYREDLKKVGIDMELRYLEWGTFLKQIDENVESDGKAGFKNNPTFDAVSMSWGGGDRDWDPKQFWHSSSAVAGGSNFIAFKNADVDRMIDKARMIVDRPQRMQLLHKVYEKIASEVPYTFFMNPRFDFYGISARVQQPADTFKYELGSVTWWLRP